MAFTLNAGEFDLGDGCIGRGTILAGEAYSNTNLQNLINTSGLEGFAYSYSHNISGGGVTHIRSAGVTAVSFRESNDALTGTITAPTITGSGTALKSLFVGGSSIDVSTASAEARYHLATHLIKYGDDDATANTRGAINASAGASPVIVSNQVSHSLNAYSVFQGNPNWRFLARDHATAITHYPSTATQGSIFAAACVNSSTQWGLWAAGAVGNRNGYFNQRHGDFAIVLLQNGANTYFYVMTPQTENSSTRNDSPLRNFNIVPAAGQTTVNDQMSELVLLKDTGSFFSSPLGTVPGLYYIDPNKTNFDSYTIGMAIDIDPDPLSTFEGRDRAIIVARWGLDATISISNSGNVFTAGGSPNRRTLENGVRVQFQTSPPSGFSTGADYWVINWNETSYTFNLASTEGGSAVTASSNTSSTIVRKAALIAMRCY